MSSHDCPLTFSPIEKETILEILGHLKIENLSIPTFWKKVSAVTSIMVRGFLKLVLYQPFRIGEALLSSVEPSKSSI